MPTNQHFGWRLHPTLENKLWATPFPGSRLSIRPAAQVTDLLALAPSGKYEEVPHGMFSGVSLDTGWYLVYINKCDHKIVSARNLQRVSVSAEIVAAVIEEHVMFSSAEGWENGSLIWKVSHASESGIDHLEEHGSLPVKYQEIRERLLAAQKQEHEGELMVDHVFDVPLEFAESIVGYKHDKRFHAQFELLNPTASAKRGLLSRLFSDRS